MTTLTTPAIASEPYCADAPSRRTSMRSMALAGMAFRSTPLEPRRHAVGERVDERRLVAAQAVDQHQRLVGRESAQRERPHESVASVTLWRGKFTEGASACSAWLVSVVPCCGAPSSEDVHRHRQLVGRGVPRARADHRINVKPPKGKIFCFPFGKSELQADLSRPTRGALRDRHKRQAGDVMDVAASGVQYVQV